MNLATPSVVDRLRARIGTPGPPTTVVVEAGHLKRFAEAITAAYHRYHGLDAKIVRIFNTYGPRMRINDGRAVPAFISQALKNEDVTVFGDGSQTRSFCYVRDLVDGLYRLTLSDERYPVNLGNPQELTILEFAERIRRLTGTSAQLEFKPLGDGKPKGAQNCSARRAGKAHRRSAAPPGRRGRSRRLRREPL